MGRKASVLPWGGASAPLLPPPPPWGWSSLRGAEPGPRASPAGSGPHRGRAAVAMETWGSERCVPDPGDTAFCEKETQPSHVRASAEQVVFSHRHRIFRRQDLSATPVSVQRKDGCAAGLGHGAAPGTRQATRLPSPAGPVPLAAAPWGRGRERPRGVACRGVVLLGHLQPPRRAAGSGGLGAACGASADRPRRAPPAHTAHGRCTRALSGVAAGRRLPAGTRRADGAGSPRAPVPVSGRAALRRVRGDSLRPGAGAPLPRPIPASGDSPADGRSLRVFSRGLTSGFLELGLLAGGRPLG